MSNNLNNNICVLIPTYNNVGTVLNVIERCYSQIKDIIVVNDGSTDATSSVLSSCRLPLIIVDYAINKGKGHALREGFGKARELGYTHVVTIDADGQHFPEDLPVLLKEYNSHPDALIIGSRPLVNENMPAGNTFANKFSNFWFKVQTGLSLPDTQTGYRVYPLGKIRGEKILTSRYEAELELLVCSAWAGVELIPATINVDYPEDRVTHFRPTADFIRISLLNTILCIVALLYGWPRTIIRKIVK